MKKSIKIELDDDIVDGINIIYNHQKDEGVPNYNEFLANIFLIGLTILGATVTAGLQKDYEERIKTRDNDNFEENNKDLEVIDNDDTNSD